MEMPVEYYGSFTILPCCESSEEVLESIGDSIREEYNFWRIDDCDLEPRSAASEASGGEVFEELVRIIQFLEEMGWQLFGYVFRCSGTPEDLELYILSQEDGEVYRKRGRFEDVD